MNKKLINSTISIAITVSIIAKYSSTSQNTNTPTQASSANKRINTAVQSSKLSSTATAAKQALRKEPSAEQLNVDSLVTQDEPALTAKASNTRKKIKEALHELLNCHKTSTCPVDNSDSRASDLLLGQQITAKLDEYIELSLNNDYFDEESAQIVNEFIANRDGYVQESALNLMSAMAPNITNAQALLTALSTSYDAKIMKQAIKELQRYPELSSQIDKLYQQSLQTGSFYVAQEIALNILPQLTSSNIAQYEAIARNLPQNSKRADALWSNIKEFKLKQSRG